MSAPIGKAARDAHAVTTQVWCRYHIDHPKTITMPTPAAVRALMRTTPTIVRLQNRSLISVSGSQAAEFLNGLLSTAVTTGSFYSSFLHAQVGYFGML